MIGAIVAEKSVQTLVDSTERWWWLAGGGKRRVVRVGSGKCEKWEGLCRGPIRARHGRGARADWPDKTGNGDCNGGHNGFCGPVQELQKGENCNSEKRKEKRKEETKKRKDTMCQVSSVKCQILSLKSLSSPADVMDST